MATLSAKKKLIHKLVGYWRQRLIIDPKWVIDIVFSEATGGPGEPTSFAEMDLGKSEYYSAEMTIFPSMMAHERFSEIISSIICHELLHLVIGDLVDLVSEETDDSVLTKTEERLVTQLEMVLCGEDSKGKIPTLS